jgi:hypothetical protein
MKMNDKVLFRTSDHTAQAFCYDDNEFEQALSEAGLTPTPLPELPVKVELPSRLILHARDDGKRVVVTVSDREVW